jgi:chitinase
MFTSQGSLVEWVGFDDVRSVELKVKYAIHNNLGGVMLWALDMDDFSGTFCNQGTYPLLRVMNFYLNPTKNIELPNYDSIWKVNSENR